MVLGEGFEPPKAEPADLQSAVFDRFTIPAWSHLSDSNRRPTVYKTVALPTELRWHMRQSTEIILPEIRCADKICIQNP